MAVPDRRYPKHVWSPAGGWYAQPANWRANTLVAGAVLVGMVAVTWKFSAERGNVGAQTRVLGVAPEQILIEWDKEDRLKAESSKAAKE
ncbi:hypothetical protein ACCO45_010868 [Purpureocillium lilacinum]|uniref:Uncharacterized protein n=1 Tax=Purpureocillium lilacinum TaxID=33203 RepID=A0ACC4DG01_PURLI